MDTWWSMSYITQFPWTSCIDSTSDETFEFFHTTTHSLPQSTSDETFQFSHNCRTLFILCTDRSAWYHFVALQDTRRMLVLRKQCSSLVAVYESMHCGRQHRSSPVRILAMTHLVQVSKRARDIISTASYRTHGTTVRDTWPKKRFTR